MLGKKTLWNVLTLAVGILGVLVPAAALVAQYDIAARGSTPEKHLQLQTVPAIDPSALVAGSILNTTIRVGEQTFEHVYVAQAFLKNVGQSPIVASDIVEPIAVNVKKPWRIVAVENSKLGTDSPTIVQLSWKGVSESRFEASPALMNPGDTVMTQVYLTPGGPTEKKEEQPEVSWTTRIVNMRSLETVPIGGTMFDESRNWGILVDLRGWATILTMVLALSFHGLYLHLLSRLRHGRDWNISTISLVLGCGLLSWSAAECIATYLFPSNLTRAFGVSHWLNAPPIVVHVVATLALWWRARASYRTSLTI